MLVSDFIKLCDSNTKYIFFVNNIVDLSKPSSGISIIKYFPYIIKEFYIYDQGVIAINIYNAKDISDFEIGKGNIKLPNNIYKISDILPLITKDNINVEPQNIIKDCYITKLTPLYDFNCFVIV